MIDGKSVLAVVPTRGGSKGIALKNLRTVAGVPMVARVGDCVKAVHRGKERPWPRRTVSRLRTSIKPNPFGRGGGG